MIIDLSRFIRVVMVESFFSLLMFIDQIIWDYIGIILIFIIGIILTIKSNFLQLRTLFFPRKHMKNFLNTYSSDVGTSPLKLYFASIGGMIGVGNIVTVMGVVVVGGPGSVVWLWIASLIGMIIKYSEVYLGVKFRIKNDVGGYDGGPMYFLKAAFNSKFLSAISCVFLCAYSVEVYQFVVLVDVVNKNIEFDRQFITFLLLVMIMISSMGGVTRLANICIAVMPIFLVSYVCLSIYVLVDHRHFLFDHLVVIFKSAFTGHAAMGGFVGSTFLTSLHYGVFKAVYAGDIGIGYDSIIQSETKASPSKQGKLAIFSVLTNMIICTLRLLMVIVTGIWTKQMRYSDYIVEVVKKYVPGADFFILLLIFTAAYTTIIGYLVVGQKCAKYLDKSIGEKTFLVYASINFMVFSFFPQDKVILMMSVSGGILMLINLCGIFKLRKNIEF